MGKVIPLEVWRSYLASDFRRGDYPDDAALWVRLLTAAYDHDGDDPQGLFGALSGVRALGAGLQVTNAGARIVPGEMDGEYADIRAQWLLPHADALRNLLKGLVGGSRCTT